MKSKRYISANMAGLLVCIILLALSGCATLPDHYVSLKDHSMVSLQEVLTEIENDRAIFVGETHGIGRDHLVQFEVIRQLHEKGKKVAVAFELIPSSQQTLLNRWLDGDISGYDFEKKYYNMWDYYSRILKYARDERIPLIAINADRAFIEQVSKNGPQVLSRDLRTKLRFIPCSEDTEYEVQLRIGSERGYHTSALPFLCDGQRLRDAVMAYNIARVLKGSGHTVVVLTGVAHASKVAVPRLLQEHVDVSYAVLMPDSVRFLLKRMPDAGVADYKWH